jgi:actin-like ATPase involved in cell morphogenesis
MSSIRPIDSATSPHLHSLEVMRGATVLGYIRTRSFDSSLEVFIAVPNKILCMLTRIVKPKAQHPEGLCSEPCASVYGAGMNILNYLDGQLAISIASSTVEVFACVSMASKLKSRRPACRPEGV